MKKIIVIILVIVALVSITLCTYGQTKTDTTWSHVYNKDRFEIKRKSITVAGIVRSVRREADGDVHIQIKLDRNQQLLNEKNYKNQDSCLVVEIIYVYIPTQKNAIIDGMGYKNTVYVPKKGEHVQITGPYVLDKHHGWMEIHPVTKVKAIK